MNSLSSNHINQCALVNPLQSTCALLKQKDKFSSLLSSLYSLFSPLSSLISFFLDGEKCRGEEDMRKERGQEETQEVAEKLLLARLLRDKEMGRGREKRNRERRR